jgi:hypothetical protein
MAKTLAELRELHKNMNTETKKGAGSSNGFWSPEEGDNLVRFLPGKDDPLDFFVETALHAHQDDQGKWHYYKCRKVENEKCPMCELYYDLWKRHNAMGMGRDDDSKFNAMARMIKPRPRFYSTAVIREEGDENPVRILSMSKQLFDRVMAAMINEDFQDEDDPDNTTIISLERGNDFNVRMTKQGQWPSYVESTAKYKKTRAGTPAQVAEWMDNELNLQSLGGIDGYEEGKELAMTLEASLNPVKTETTSDNPPWDEEGDLKV